MKHPVCGVLACVGVFLGVALHSSLVPLLAHAPHIRSGASIPFREVTTEVGLFDPISGIMGHGAAWGDYDRDGLVDLYVGGFADRPDSAYVPASGPVRNRLFRNLGERGFQEVESPAVELRSRTSGAVFVDLDNNGTLELFVPNNTVFEPRRDTEPQRTAQLDRSHLFRNDDGRLTDISVESGIRDASPRSARNVGVLDVDLDGLLDLLILQDLFVPTTPRSVLLHNRGGLRFEPIEGALPDGLFGLGLAIADINDDGRGDIFVAHSNRLLLSSGDGTYREVEELNETFAYTPMGAEDWPSGAAFGDLDRDGLLDLVVTTHHEPARNRVFLNEGLDANGVPRFREVTRQAGLATPVPTKCPHVEIQDFDNDGWPDIYTTAAWLDGGQVIPLIYRGLGVRDGVPRFEPPRPIGDPMVYYPAGPTADYDADGRLDLFLVNWFRENHSRLLRNEGPSSNWLDVRVVGTTINRMGVGAKVAVYPAGEANRSGRLLGYQEVRTGYGYASGQAAVSHFGLGDVAAVDVVVLLPDGRRLVRRGVPAGSSLIVQEQDG